MKSLHRYVNIHHVFTNTFRRHWERLRNALTYKNATKDNNDEEILKKRW